MPAHVDLTGTVVNGITITGVSHKDSRSNYHWHCRCHCGTMFTSVWYVLKIGSTRSCGCVATARNHGKVNTPEYGVWAAMKRRCLNPNVRHYERYGGRGIRVCGRWMEFQNFLADMGSRPSSRHQLDRIDNDGDYAPGNCRWALVKTQSRNRSNNIMLTHNDTTMCVQDWAKQIGVKPSTLYARLKRGWSDERTICTPVRFMAPRQARPA